MIVKTKLSEQSEQFELDGVHYVGRRVQINAGDFAYDVSRTWCLPDGFRGTVEFDSVLFRLDHGSLVFVDPSRLSPYPSSKIEEPIKDVRKWLYHNGSRPSNEAIEVFTRKMATDWRLAKNNGMDGLADSVADVLAKVVAVLKDSWESRK